MNEEFPSDSGAGIDPAGGGLNIPEDTNVYKWVAATLLTLFTGAMGLIYKNHRSSQNLEDATNETTVETIRSQRERIKELEEQNRTLFAEVQTAGRAQLESEGAASRASVAAQLAHEAAQRASQAAGQAQEEAARAHRLASIRKQYIIQLREVIVSAGLSLPPEPQE